MDTPAAALTIVRTRPEGVASPRSPVSFPAMCNLYSITTNQAAIAALFRVVVLTEGRSGHA